MAHQLPRPGKKLCMPFTLKVAPFIVGAVNHQHHVRFANWLVMFRIASSIGMESNALPLKGSLNGVCRRILVHVEQFVLEVCVFRS